MDQFQNSKAPQFAAAGVTATLLHRAPYDVSYTPDKLVAGFAFDVQCGTHAFASDRPQPFVTKPGCLALTPKGCDIHSQSKTGGEYLTVSIAGHTPANLVQFSGAHRKMAAHYAHKIRRRLLLPNPDPVGVEEDAHLLFEEALLVTRGHITPSKPANSITPRRLRMLADLVEAKLGYGLTVSDLAAAVGLSVGFFIRAFRAATGLTPHAYVTERRLAEVRRHIRLGPHSLVEIALETGFANQAHMTSAFSRAFGITPGVYRRHICC
jgi:AraC family transcriptional regulator